jgi:adenosylmethionine-8-amino-7-oxononanoate aminotransferase
MNRFVVLGTDTDAGKTTFSLLWLTHFAPRFGYWKPLETGPSDSGRIAELVPTVRVHSPLLSLRDAVAPQLAARKEGCDIPGAEAIAVACPGDEALLIETFGGPFSPLNDSESQIEVVRRFGSPTVMVGPSTVGAIGRCRAMMRALRSEEIVPRAIVLLGAEDKYAETELARDGVPVFGFRGLGDGTWTMERLREAAAACGEKLDAIERRCFRATAVSAVRGDSRHERAVVRAVARFHGRGGRGTESRGATRIADWLDADRRCVWHPYTRLDDADEPLAVVGADAEFLHLADGRRIVDGIASWWTIQHGHRHPPLVRALRDATERIDHVLFAGATHPWGALLAEQLLATTTWTGGRVFYSENGSTAVEVALKLAYQFWVHRGEPKRTTFLGFEHGYHGDTFGAMAISRDPTFFGTFEPLLFRAEILPLDPNRVDDWLSHHPNEAAGIVVEPLVQGAGGMRFHEPATLCDLFDVARRHDVLFVADEVMTGLGRLGPFWAHAAAGISPDLIATAKTIAGGLLPLAATLVAPRIVDGFQERERFCHGHSFTAHPLACAVGLANLPLVRAAIPAAPARLEDFWRKALADMANRPLVREVRVRGSIAAVELDVPGGYLADAARIARRAALAEGVLLRPLGNVVYVLPPWCTSEESLNRIAAALGAGLDAVASTR